MSIENYEDLLRHSIIRFAGYYHEVGQHLNNCWNLPLFLSGFSASYVFCDLLEKCRRQSVPVEKNIPPKPQRKKEIEDQPEPNLSTKIAIEASDVILWHILATIVIPHLIVGGVKQATANFLCKTCEQFQYKRSVASIVGLLTIPILSSLIDHLTTEFMEFSYRPLFK